ncbi:MAG: hypothetical protein AAGI13_00070 [Pseudomonadota bacterium]
MTLRLSLFLCAALSACAIPDEDLCFTVATRELATVYSLIAQAEDSALRGYRLEEETWVDIDVSDCYATLSPRTICTNQFETRRDRPVAVDEDQERKIAADLRARVPALKEQARVDYNACMINAQVQ